MSETILIVDDEADLRRLVDFNLRSAGFNPLLAASGREALQLIEESPPDLVLLDLMLPDIQGKDICRQLKQDNRTRHIPVIMVTALGDEIDRVVGFELGADDYVVKPFSVRELILRVRAILKRSTGQTETEVEEILFGPLKVDLAKHRAWLNDEELNLTALEFKLLTTFVKRRGHVQTRERLLDDVWGIDAGVTTRTVDTHVKRLREKLGEMAACVETVRGVGYRFAETPSHE